MNARKAEKILSWFSIVSAGIYASVYDFKFAEIMPYWIVQYTSAAMLIFFAILSLRSEKNVYLGWLAGAWGFVLCLTSIGFLDSVQQYTFREIPMLITLFLGVVFLFALLAFICSLFLVWRAGEASSK